MRETMVFAKEWPPEWKNLNIATLELFPILAALYTWEKEAQDETVHVHTDNKAVVTVINRLYAKDKGLRQLVKPLALHCLSKNINLQAHHIEGSRNIGADLLSRGKIKEFLEKFLDMNNAPAVMPVYTLPENIILKKY